MKARDLAERAQKLTAKEQQRRIDEARKRKEQRR